MNETQTTEWLVESARYSAVVKIESDLYDVDNYEEKRMLALEAMTLAMAGWLEELTETGKELTGGDGMVTLESMACIISARLLTETEADSFYTQTATIAYNLSAHQFGDVYREIFDGLELEDSFLFLVSDVGTCIGIQEIDAFVEEKNKKYHK